MGENVSSYTVLISSASASGISMTNSYRNFRGSRNEQTHQAANRRAAEQRDATRCGATGYKGQQNGNSVTSHGFNFDCALHSEEPIW